MPPRTGSIGGIDISLTVAFTVPAMIASLLGARLAAKLPGKGLQIGFAVLVLVIAVVNPRVDHHPSDLNGVSLSALNA